MATAEFLVEGKGESKILVEVDELPAARDGERDYRPATAIAHAAQSLEESLSTIKAVAAKVLNVIRELGPDEGEVTLGFKLTASSGVVLAKVGGEANIGVKLVWKASAPA